ncbi:MAG: hypothetical protein K2O85_01955, partial [Helicobacter sp.]|nr:hypothetical protein [Helicobacter sp.]
VQARAADSMFAILALPPLELPQKVHLLFKETDILLAHKDSALLSPNVYAASVQSIIKGELFWQVAFGFGAHSLVALVLAENAKAQNLESQTEFLWSIKPTEITLQSDDT